MTHPVRAKLSTLALTAILSTTVFATACSAQETVKSETKTEKMAKEDAANMQIADDAYLAVRDIRTARMAIFNGDTQDALTYTQAALANLDEATATLDTFKVDTQKDAPTGDAYLPFDSSLLLSEGFVPSEEKAAHIDKANKHIAKGEQKQALDTLRLAEIDVTLSTALLPVKTSRAHVKEASDLLRSGDFYEANLALKAVEDLVIIESYGIDALPKQGK